MIRHIFLALLFLILPLSSARADIVTGLAGWWRLDETSGASARDASGRGNTGTLKPTGTEPSFVSGQFGNALSFNGTSNYVDCGNTASLISSFGGSYTVALWVKSSTTTTTRGLWVKKAGTRYNAVLFNYPSVGQVKFYAGAPLASAALSSIANNLNNGIWRHLVFILDGTTQRIYVDSVFDNSQEASGVSASVSNFIFGDDTNSRFLDGLIDDVRIYNRALTQTDITELYNYHTSTTLGNAVIRNAVIK